MAERPTARESAPGGHAVEEELDREIGFVGAAAIGVGTMIAAGIFVLSGLAVSNVGAAAIVSFLLAAIVAGFTAAAYGEFSSIYPESGGGYMYVANTFDTDLTYIMGWTMILGYPASAAFYLASFSEWFFRFIYPVLNIPEAIPFWVSGVGVLALLVGVNIKGTEESNQFQIVVTALKIVLIGLFLYGGLQALEPATVTTSMAENIGSFRDIGLTSALVFITFFGFSAIATNAEEIKSPGRTVPRAIYFSMGLVTIIYTLVVLTVVVAVNDLAFLEFLSGQQGLGGVEAARDFVAGNGEVAMGLAAEFYLGGIGFYIIIVGALFSMLSAANATIMAGSRVKLAMARRDHLPRGFEDLHPRLNTPFKTVLLTGGLILLYLLVFSVLFGFSPGASEHAGEGVADATAGLAAGGPLFGLHLGIEGLAQFANFLLLSGLTIVNVAVIYSRRKFPDVERPFRVPLVPWVPIVAILANVGLLLNVEFTSFAIGVLAEVIGIGIWFAWKSRPPSIERLEAEAPTAVAEYTSPGLEYRVVVPIANPANVDQLMDTACTLADEHDGEVLVVSVVTVPEQTPLSEGRQFADDKRAVLERAIDYAAEQGVPVSGTIRIAHHAGHAILATLEQHDADAVLLGWQGRRPGRRDVVFAPTVDTVVRDAPCDVFLKKIGTGAAEPVESILLPTAGGPHAAFAREIAGIVARSTGARLHVVTVLKPGASRADRERAETLLDAATDELSEFDVTADLIEDDDVVGAIVTQTRDHDLLLIGGTRESMVQRVLFGAIPEAVGQRAHTTVIMTKRHLDLGSRLQQALERLRLRVTGRSHPLDGIDEEWVETDLGQTPEDDRETPDR